MSTKPIVFISHIGTEAEVAASFKKLISASFLNLFDVFVSSDGASIHMGQKWLQSVSDALQQCVVELIVASPISVIRPWVNFEAGAGWVRGIPVIPLCHSGVTPATLPVPLNMLQGARASDRTDLHRVFEVLAMALGATPPQVDFSSFINDVADFEQRYLYWDEVNGAFQTIHDNEKLLIDGLKANAGVQTNLDDGQINAMQPACALLETHKILASQFRLATAYGPGGAMYLCRFARGIEFASTLSNACFRQPR